MSSILPLLPINLAVSIPRPEAYNLPSIKSKINKLDLALRTIKTNIFKTFSFGSTQIFYAKIDLFFESLLIPVCSVIVTSVVEMSLSHNGFPERFRHKRSFICFNRFRFHIYSARL